VVITTAVMVIMVVIAMVIMVIIVVRTLRNLELVTNVVKQVTGVPIALSREVAVEDIRTEDREVEGTKSINYQRTSSEK
jgi:uncharacterized protein YoxC